MGEPVLFIHRSILPEPALADRCRLVSYHRRGFAGSARPAGEVSMARRAADTRAVLAHLGIARAHVAGPDRRSVLISYDKQTRPYGLTSGPNGLG